MSSADRATELRRAALARGARAEAWVATQLEQRGWTVLDRNWRGRGGELDIVVVREGKLRFVEVKARAPGDELGLDAVTVSKQRKLIRAAEQYLSELRDTPQEACFLVAVVACHEPEWTVEWIDDAFDGS